MPIDGFQFLVSVVLNAASLSDGVHHADIAQCGLLFVSHFVQVYSLISIVFFRCKHIGGLDCTMGHCIHVHCVISIVFRCKHLPDSVLLDLALE